MGKEECLKAGIIYSTIKDKYLKYNWFVGDIKMKIKKGSFFWTYFTIFVIHCTFFFGGITVNEDNYTMFRDVRDKATMGRWLADVLYEFGLVGAYRHKSWYGILFILGMACTSMLLIELLKIKKDYLKLAIIIISAAFPSLAYSNSYVFGSVIIALSILFATMAVYATNRMKSCFSWLLGGVFLMLSLALYQAYIGYCAALALLCVMYSILLKEKKSWLVLTKNALMGIWGGGLYLASVKIYNALCGIELRSYKGLDEMGKMSLTEIPLKIKDAYLSFFKYLSGKMIYVPDIMVVLNYFFVFVIIVFSIVQIVKMILSHKYIDTIIYTFLLILAPVAVCFLDIVSNLDSLSLYGMVIFYISMVCLFDSIDVDKHHGLMEKLGKMAHFTGIVSVVVISLFLIFSTQIFYYKMAIYYERTYAMANRLQTRIEMLEEYPEVNKLAICGELRSRKDYAVPKYNFKEKVFGDRGTFYQYIGLAGLKVSDYGLAKLPEFMNSMLGLNYESPNKVDILELVQTEEYQEMPLYPKQGSIKVINDMIVVKFNDTDEWASVK